MNNNSTKKIITAASGAAALTAVLIYGTTVSGCANKQVAADPRPHIDHAAEGVKAIPPLMDHAVAETKQIERKVKTADIPLIAPHTEAIRQDATQAKEKAVTATADLKMAVDATEALKAANGQLQGKVTKLEADLDEARQTRTRGVLLLSILTVMAGVGLFFYGQPLLGSAIGTAGLTGVVLALVVSQAGLFVGIGAGVILISVLGYMTYRLVIERRATNELAQTIEVAKQRMAPTNRAKAFGAGAVPGEVDLIQSESTKKMVKKARGKGKTAPVKLAKTAA